MAKEVYMPVLGMNQDTGTLLRWLKREGDAVQKGDPLMEVATDKTDVEIEAPASGVLRAVSAAEGEEVPVGKVIAWIAAPDEAIPGAKPATPAPAAPANPTLPLPQGGREPGSSSTAAANISPVAARMVAEHGLDAQQIKPATGSRIQKEDVLAYLAGQTAPAGRILASPKARRLAQEAGLDLAALPGSGPDGAVLAADVATAAAAPVASAIPAPTPAAAAAPAAPPVTTQTAATQTAVPMSRMWKIMAERLTQSWTSIPHFFLAREVDATAFKAWHSRAQSRSQSRSQSHSQTKLTYTDLLVKLVSVALRAHPRVNAAWVDGQIIANTDIHVGLAVAVEDGLLVPVIRHSDRLGLGELAAARADLVSRAQAGKLAAPDLQGGTFTISNLGMFGIDQFSAIINPPQAAILAVGRIADRIVALDGAPAVRPMLTLNLSADHRVLDGARAARFLDHLAALIEDPLAALE